MDRDAHLYTPKQISIHSLRMEGDGLDAAVSSIIDYISIHSLRMEGDHHTAGFWQIFRHFNPLPPYGGRRTYGKSTA